MLSFATLRSSVAALVLASSLFAAAQTQASDCHVPRYTWKNVTVYVTVEKPYTDYVVRYDHCGKPYAAKVTRYKSVRVPVQKRVKVWY